MKKGSHQSSVSKEKIRLARLKNRTGTEFKKGPNNPNHGKPSWNRGVSPSVETKLKQSVAAKKRTGKNSNHWKGGITPLNGVIRKTDKYIGWRTNIFRRDHFTCQECGQIGGQLEAHHIKAFGTMVINNDIKTIEQAIMCENLWDLNNGITLCKECHKKTNNYLRR